MFWDGRMRKITLKRSLPARLEQHFSEELNDSQAEPSWRLTDTT